MSELQYEDEIYERIIELEHIAKCVYVYRKSLYIFHSDWDEVIGMLSDDEAKEYEELMAMWDELRGDDEE